METVRATVRSIAFAIYFLVLVLVLCAGLPFCTGNKDRRIRLKNWLISRWASSVATLLGAKMNIKGPPPEPPFFLISNHLSYIDILPFWKHLKTTFIAKSDIQKWPFFGQAAQLLGIIFINRENRKDLNRVNTLIKENMTLNQGMILFPEGTSSKGKSILPFKSSLLYYPASQKHPVYYASISYNVNCKSSKKAWKDICWWGDMDFLSHFWGLLKIKSWTVTVHFGEKPVIDENRKKLARSLHHRTTDIFKPTFTNK